MSRRTNGSLADTAVRTRALAAVVGGLVGGVLMGAMILGPGGGEAFGLIAIMYGVSIESDSVAIVGIVMHLVHAVVLALLFAAAVSWRPVAEGVDAAAARVPRFGTAVVVGLLGLVYGVVVWVAGWGYVMTEWLFRVGFQYYDPWGGWLGADTLVLHLVYAVPMALVFVAVSRRFGGTEAPSEAAPGAA